MIMVLPSIIISLFFLIGFSREYHTKMDLKYSSQLLGQDISNATDLSPNQMSDLIQNMATMTGHGDRQIASEKNKTAFAEKGQKYFKDIMSNPTLPNIL